MPSFVQRANDVTALPFDHHMLMGLVALRALLVIENSGIDYLGPPSTFGCTAAAKEIYTALSVGDNIALLQAAHGNSHCQMPSSQGPGTAFFNKFFFKQSANTGFMKSDRGV